MKNHLSLLFSLPLIFCFCSAPAPKAPDASAALESAAKQYVHMAEMLSGERDSLYPKSYNRYMERLQTSRSDWWCSGFYPGTLFQLYRATGEKALWDEGVRVLGMQAREQYNTTTHDVGFMIYCSFGEANKIEHNPAYDTIIVNGARSLCTRFNPIVGCIKAHNRGPNEFGVIIDNMMNLEILFEATRMTGDSTFWKTAVTHANTTLKNHFRPDGSLYHGIGYNPATGAIDHYQGGQGYTQNSPWARGQAWGVYGFTMAYRYTKDPAYLAAVEKLTDYLFAHPNMPADLVPYWDFDAPGIPNTLRDASAAAIIASGFFELMDYVNPAKGQEYFKKAEKILSTLSSPKYTTAPGTNGGFILMHSAGNIPAYTEVDVPLTYADYYYVEALMRYNEIMKK